MASPEAPVAPAALQSHAQQMEKIDAKLAALDAEIAEIEAELKGTKDSKKQEGLRARLGKKREQRQKVEIQKSVKDDLKTIALGTSKINYMDPRITIAWCKRNEASQAGSLLGSTEALAHHRTPLLPSGPDRKGIQQVALGQVRLGHGRRPRLPLLKRLGTMTGAIRIDGMLCSSSSGGLPLNGTRYKHDVAYTEEQEVERLQM